MIELFNQRLLSYNNQLASLRILRNQLASANEAVFETVMAADKEQKGSLSHSQLIEEWMQQGHADKDLKAFLQKCFPFDQISYSTLTSFVVGESFSQSLQKQNYSISEINSKIGEILLLQYRNNQERVNILEEMNNFVPTLYAKPTKKQFEEYVIAQRLGVDIYSLSKHLQLPDLPTPPQRLQLHEQFPNTLNDLTLQRLEKTMDRLKMCVRDFGSEWLK